MTVKKKSINAYKVTLGTGTLFFIKARTKGEARDYANVEMVNMYGKQKYIASIVEVSQDDRDKYPMFFKRGKKGAIGRKNPSRDWHKGRLNYLNHINFEEMSPSQRQRHFGKIDEEVIALGPLGAGRSNPKRKNPKVKSVSKELLPALIIGTVIVAVIGYARRKATS